MFCLLESVSTSELYAKNRILYFKLKQTAHNSLSSIESN